MSLGSISIHGADSRMAGARRILLKPPGLALSACLSYMIPNCPCSDGHTVMAIFGIQCPLASEQMSRDKGIGSANSAPPPRDLVRGQSSISFRRLPMLRRPHHNPRSLSFTLYPNHLTAVEGSRQRSAVTFGTKSYIPSPSKYHH